MAKCDYNPSSYVKQMMACFEWSILFVCPTAEIKTEVDQIIVRSILYIIEFKGY